MSGLAPGAVAVEALVPDSIDAGVAAHYGDPLREQRQLETAAGLVDRSNRGVLAVRGTDRLTWLHSLTTQHLSSLAAMAGTELLVLSPHGHIEHHAVVLDDGTTTWLDVEPGAAPPLREFLDRMRFLMQVEVSDCTGELALLSLVGPASPGALARLGAPADLAPPQIAPVPGPKFATGTVPPGPTARYSGAKLPAGGYVRRMPYGYDLLVPRPAVPEIVSQVDVPLAGLWAFEALRVAARRPRLSFDTDHRTLPAEVGSAEVGSAEVGWLATAVHLEKGCYRGQEAVARVHHMGRPPRRLVLLHLDGVSTGDLPARGSAVTTVDGKSVGIVGTAAYHWESGPIALALVRHSTPSDADLRVGSSAAAMA